jgi:hypothetical protein
MGEPGLAAPASILDLLNYQLHLLLSFSTAEVTRLCEREHGITRHEWGGGFKSEAQQRLQWMEVEC